MASEHPFYLAGDWQRSAAPLDVVNPYDNSIVGRTWLAGDDEFDQATRRAVDAAPVMRALPAYERSAILRRASEATGCEILGKAEFLNPGGSIKDRAALATVLDAGLRSRWRGPTRGPSRWLTDTPLRGIASRLRESLDERCSW